MEGNEAIPKPLFESAPCPNGCEGESQVLFTARDRLFRLPGEFTVVKCGTCSLIRTDPRPTQDTIGFFYPETDYCAYLPLPQTAAVNTTRAWRVFRYAYQKLVRRNTRNVPSIRPGKMLEIGCATGHFLAEMAAKGWQVQGVEMSPGAAAQARAAGFEVSCGALESLPDLPGGFDLIAAWMVVEHLHDPVLSLRKLARWGSPGCWLAISVPDATDFQLRLFRDRWFALQAPTHLYHFTVKSIRQVLAQGGWRVERVFYQRSLANYSRSLSYVFEDVGAPSWLSMLPRRLADERLMYPISCLLAALRETGLITVWARKAEVLD